jgi:membrane associated rhomboid family serine protease
MTTTILLIVITVAISILCFNSPRLFDALSLRPYRVVEEGQWWRIVTHGFVHGDYIHLFVNMIVLYSFGTYTEVSFARLAEQGVIGNPDRSYLLLYFGGMVLATIHDLIRNRHNPYYSSIGASGAVSAVVFSTIFLNPWGKILLFGIIPIPGILFGIFYLGYSQGSAQRGQDNINHYAHIYGALYGFVFPLLMNPSLIHDFLEAFRF